MSAKSMAYSLVAGLAGLTVPVHANSQSRAASERISAVRLDKMDFAETPAFPGVSSAFVLGTFDADGLYTAQAEMKKGSVFPPHAHPDVRMTLVLSGTTYLGEGETFEECARCLPGRFGRDHAGWHLPLHGRS